MEAALRLGVALLTYVLSQAGPLGMKGCDLKPVDKASNVKAFYTNSTTVRGCVSRVSRNSTQEVHVLNVKESLGQVFFQVEQKEDFNPSRKVIIIVNVDRLLTMMPSAQSLLPSIYVPDGVFVMTPSLRLVASNATNLPAESEKLLLWAQEKFGSVASFAELHKPSKIRLTLSAGGSHLDSCSLQDGFSSQGFLEWDSVLEEMSSCQIPESGALKEAHILQVLDDAEEVSSLHTDIKVSTSQPDCVLEEHAVLLILQSPSKRSWTIDSQHSFKIMASGNYCIKSFSSVFLPGEQLPGTPEQLVHLARDKGFAKISYTQMAPASSIILHLQNCGSSPTAPEESINTMQPTVNSLSEGMGLIEGLFSMLRPWRCTKDYLTITLAKAHIQALPGVNIQKITLQDPTCRVQENDTHIFLTNKTSTCQTTIEPSNRVRNQLLLTISSKEDPIPVPFECFIPDVTLEIFQDSQFVHPSDSVEAEKKTYAQMSVSVESGEPYASIMECSLKPAGEDRRVLILLDSPQTPTVEILEPLKVDSRHKIYRFSFMYRAGAGPLACGGVLTCELCMELENARNCPSSKLMKTSLEVSLTNPNSPIQEKGLGTSAVLGITCGAFLIGALLTAALWFIYSYTRPSVRKQPVSRQPVASESSSTNHSIGSTQSTPCSTSSMA